MNKYTPNPNVRPSPGVKVSDTFAPPPWSWCVKMAIALVGAAVILIVALEVI